MNVAGKALWEATLVTNAAVTQYTAVGCKARVDAIPVTNPNSVNYLVTLYVIAVGGTASATNTAIYQRTVLAGQTVNLIDLLGSIWLQPGDFIQILADTSNKLTSRGSGIETFQ